MARLCELDALRTRTSCAQVKRHPYTHVRARKHMRAHTHRRTHTRAWTHCANWPRFAHALAAHKCDERCAHRPPSGYVWACFVLDLLLVFAQQHVTRGTDWLHNVGCNHTHSPMYPLHTCLLKLKSIMIGHPPQVPYPLLKQVCDTEYASTS